MTKNNIRNIPKRIIALLLAVMTVVSFATSIVFADNELSIWESSTNVTSGSRSVLYNAGGTSVGGYDTVISENQFTLTKTVDEASMNEWLTALKNSYYSGDQYNNRSLNDGKTGTDTIGYAVKYVDNVATECDPAAMTDTNNNPVYSERYYYLYNGQVRSKSAKYITLDENNAIVIGEKPTAWLLKGNNIDSAIHTDFYLVPASDETKALTISGENGSYTLSLMDIGASENQLFNIEKGGTYTINSKDVDNGNIRSNTLTNAYLDAVAIKDGTGVGVGCSKRGNNHAYNWIFEYVEPVDMVYPEVDYNWNSSDTSIADISSSGEVVIYKPGTVTFTCTATVETGMSSAVSSEVGGNPLSKSFSATYTFVEHEASTKENPLKDTSDTANFPAKGEEGSVVINKTAEGDSTSYDTTGVAKVQLDIESLTVEDPIDVVLVIDVSRSMVAFHDYDVVYCEGTRTEVTNADGDIIDVEFTGTRDITYYIRNGYIDDDTGKPYEGAYEAPVYNLGGDIVYYCRYDADANNFSLIQKITGDNPDTTDVTETEYEAVLKTDGNIKNIAPDGYYGENNVSSDEYIKNYDKLNAARESAASFVTTLLETSPESRIALVQFSDDDVKADGTTYAVNSRVVSEYTSDKDKLLSLIYNTATASDNRYGIAGAGSSYDRYRPSTTELDAAEANLAANDIGLTLSNRGGTNYGLAFLRAEEVINADNADPNTIKNDRQIVLFMTDGGPNTLNIGEDSMLAGTNENLNDIGKDNDAWAYFALRRQMEAKLRIEELSYEIISIAFDLESDSAAYFAPYEAGGTYSIDTNDNTNTYKTSLVDDLVALGHELTADSSEDDVLTALRKQIVKNIATYENGFYEVSRDHETNDYSGLEQAYKDIAKSLIVKTTETEVTDVIGDKYELRLLPYNGKNSQIVIYSSSVTYDDAGNATYGTAQPVETVTFTGTTLAGGITYTDVYVDAKGAEQTVTGTITAEPYTLSGKYFTFDSETKTFIWSIGDVADEKFTFTYDAYLTASDPAYEIAMGRTNDQWLTDGEDKEFADAAADATLDTNDSAKALYKNWAGEYCEQTYVKPKLGWETTSVTVTKVWNDNNHSIRPTEIKVQLKVSENGGTAYNVYNTAELSSSNNWQTTWNDLPLYSDGTAKLTYSVVEVSPHAAYDNVVTGSNGSFVITNELVDYNVTVNYEDTKGNTIKSSVTPYVDEPRGNSYDVVAKGCKPSTITADDGTVYYFVEHKDTTDAEIGTLASDKNITYIYTLVEQPTIVKAVDKTLIKITDENGTYAVSYTLTVSNPNDFAITNVKVSDVLPDGLTFADSTVTGEWTIDSIPANGSKDITFTANLSDKTASAALGSEAPYKNTAEIIGISVDPDNDGTSTEITYPTPIESNEVVTNVYKDPTIVKSVDNDKAAAGEMVTYTITVTNTAGVPLYDMVITDEIPAGMTSITTGECATIVVNKVPADFTGAQASVSVTDGKLNANVPCIAAGGIATITLKVEITDPSKITYTNKAVIEEGYLEPVDPDNPGTPDVPEIPSNEVVTEIDSEPYIEKSVDKAYARKGDTLTYTVTVKNPTADTLYNVVVTDVLPAGLTYGSSTGNGEYTESTRTIEWTLASIVSGGEMTVTVMATVADETKAPYKNVATLVSGKTDENDDGTPDTDHTYNKSDDAETGIILDPTISKAVDKKLIKLIDENGTYQITYVITVSNPNSFAITDVNVRDILPDGLTFADSTVTGEWTIDSIPANGSKGITFTVNLSDKTDSTALGSEAPYKNTAEITGMKVDPDNDGVPTDITYPTPIESNEVVTGVYKDPSIIKAVDKTLINITDEDGTYSVTYTLTVSNPNPFAITNVKVSDVLPNGLIFADSTVTGEWTIDSIPANSSKDITFTANLGDKTASAVLGSAAPYINTAEITGMTADPDGDGEFSSITYADPIESNEVVTDVYKDPTISKAVDKTLINITNENGSYSVTYTLTVSNPNDFAITNVKVSDVLHDGLTFADSTVTGEWTIDSIPANSSKDITFTANLSDKTDSAALGSNAPYRNAAEITGMKIDPDNDGTSTDITYPTPIESNEVVTDVYKDPTIVKAVDKTLIKITDENGTYTVTYTLTVSNPNDFAITNVKVSDVLPDGLTFADSTVTGEWTIDSIPANSSKDITFTANLSDKTASAALGSEAPYKNTAEITGISVDPDGDGEPSNITYANPIESNEVVTNVYKDPTIVKSVDKNKASAGETVTYTITVTNTARVPLYDLTVTDAIPDGMTPITGTSADIEINGVPADFTGGSPSVDVASTQLNAYIPCIDIEGTAVITLMVKITDPSKITYTNQAVIEKGYLEPVDPDAPGTPDVPEIPSNEVVTEIDSEPYIEKSVDKAYARKGDTLTYTVTVKNPTADTLYNVVVTDVLPAGLTYGSSTGNGEYTESTRTIEWTLDSIASGGEMTVTVMATVADETKAPYKNVATLVSGKTDENDDGTPDTDHTYNKSDDAETGIILDPTISKAVDTEIADHGDTITYTLTIANPNKSIDLLNVVVSDPLPEGLTYVSSSPAGEYDEATRTVEWTVSKLTANSTAALTISATVSDRSKAIYFNTAYIDEAVADIDKGNENTGDREMTYPDGTNKSNTVETDVCYDLVIEYRKYDETVEGGIGDRLQPDYESLDNLRGTEYDVNGEIDDIIITENGEVWAKKLITPDSSERKDVYDEDKKIVVVYEKYDSLYTLTKQVSLDGVNWSDAVTTEPGATVYFRINVKNNVAYPVSGLSLSDKLTFNGSETAMPNEWESIIAAFETETGGQLAANGEWNSSTMSCTVPAASVNGDRIVNTATITNTDTEIPTLTDDAVVNVVAESGLKITKNANVEVSEDGKKYVAAGQRVSFTLIVENTGNTVLSNVKVIDDTYDVIVVEEDGTERTAAKGTVIDTIAVLEPGKAESMTVYIDIPETAYSGEEFHNYATAKADDPNGGDELTSTDDDIVERTPDKLPELSIVKTVNNTDASETPIVVKPGEFVTYTVTVSNTGNADAENVYVVDYMLDGSNLVSADWAINDAWVIEKVPAGGSVTLTAQISSWQLPLATPAGTVITNVAELYDSQEDYEDGKDPIDTDQAKVTADAVYSIDVNKTTDVSAVKPGEKIGYTIYVTNTGNAVLNDILVTDALVGTWGELPAKTEGENDVEITLNNDNTLTIDTLAQDDAVRLSFETTVSETTSASDVTNNVAVEAEKPDGTKVTDDGEAVTKIFYNQLEIVKKANVETAEAGDKVIYTVTVTNTGDSELANVVVTDNLPVTVLKEYIAGSDGKLTETQLSKNTISTGDINAEDYAPDTIIGYITAFAAGECRVFTLEYTVPETAKADDVIWNTAKATADGGHEDSASDDVKVVVPVVHDYKLEISKTANAAMVEAGGTITYTITVTNTGKDPLTNVAVTDSLNVTYNGTLYPAGNVIKTIETLPVGKSETIIVTYAVPKNQTGSEIKNTAAAKADETDKVTDDVTVKLESPSIAISKTVNTTNPVAGQKVYYTLVVTNTGNCTLTDLLVSDPQIGYSVTIAKLEPGEKWTSPSGALYYTFAAGASSGTTFKNSASVSNTKVKGSSNASASITTGGNNYITPDTGDSLAAEDSTFSTILCITAVSAIICLMTAAGLYIRKRRKNGENIV